MIDNKEIFSILDNVKIFIKSLRNNNTYTFEPVKKGATKYGQNLTLGFSSYAMKIYYMLGIWEDLSQHEQNEWINYINSFQKQDSKFGKNFYVDSTIVNYYEKFQTKNEIKNLSKLLLNTFLGKNYDLKSTKLLKAINADTKQAISTLYEVGSKNSHQIPNKFSNELNLISYLDSLDWSKPWSAGAQFSSMCVYSVTQNYKNEESLVKYATDIVDSDTGSYFKFKPQENREVINGAMKIITGLDWLNHEIHYPKKLIDYCLANEPLNEGCDIVDYIYVLYKCSEETTYKKNQIDEKMVEGINKIKNLYLFNDLGFSYFENKSQDYYYGVPITNGLKTADIHGTLLCCWGLMMAMKTVGVELENFKIIKP